MQAFDVQLPVPDSGQRARTEGHRDGRLECRGHVHHRLGGHERVSEQFVADVRQGDDQYPRFETYREQIDGKYWFPTYTHADDTLHFKSGESPRIRMTVTYKDYKRYEGKSTIKYGDVVDDKGKPAGAPTTNPKTAPK